MTRLLEQAFDKVAALPDAQQDELARVMLQLAGVDQPPLQLTADEEADLAEADAEIERGEFARPTTFAPFGKPARVMPSATPTEANLKAWAGLPCEEQLRRYREMFEHPDCSHFTDDTPDDILAAARQRIAARSDG